MDYLDDCERGMYNQYFFYTLTSIFVVDPHTNEDVIVVHVVTLKKASCCKFV